MSGCMLRGREHPELAEIGVQAEGETAIALSRGGAPKVYAHTDPNEDVALCIRHESGLVLAVADGHGGYEAAEIALETVRQWAGVLPDRIAGSDAWRRLALALTARANERIRARAAQGGRRLSRTTLAVAVVDAAADTVRWASVGDSHVFHAADGVLDLGEAWTHDHGELAEAYFLGYCDETEDTLAGKCRLGEEPLAGSQALVLVTDGLSERGVGVDDPEETVAEVVAAVAGLPEPERAPALARGVVEAALAAHRRRRSGDNVAAATAWLTGLRAR